MFCSIALAVLTAAPQSPWPRRAVLPGSNAIADLGVRDAARIVVKLAEGGHNLVHNGRIAAREVLDLVGDRQVRPLFAGLERQLDELRARQLLACGPGREPL